MKLLIAIMLKMSCHILIGDFEFDFVHQAKVISSWKELTDTCRILMPRNVRYKDLKLNDAIKAGDEVNVQLGYDGELQQVFSGYVTRVEPTIPVKIHCEDAMWKLKQTNYNLSWEDVSLSTVLNAVIKDVPFETNIEAELGDFQVKNASAAKVLEALKRNYGIVSYMRNGKLVVGQAYPDNPTRHEFHFQHNVISTSLEYRTKDQAKIKIKAISIKPENTKEEVEVGDSVGELHTLHYYNISGSELKARAQSKLARLKVEGYRGSFLTFGMPVVQHGDVVELIDPEYGDRSGDYFVDKVERSFGKSDGYKQEITLGSKFA